jgi:hypothetical protein
MPVQPDRRDPTGYPAPLLRQLRGGGVVVGFSLTMSALLVYICRVSLLAGPIRPAGV